MSVDFLTVIFRNPFARFSIYVLGLRMGMAYRDYRFEDDSKFFKGLSNSRFLLVGS